MAVLHDLSERVFALYYPRLIQASEDAGQREIRQALIAGARGRTLELGAGSGINLCHYTSAVSELVLSEPSPHMIRHLKAGLADGSCHSPDAVRLLQAPAEAIPEADGSFDTVVATFILCTTPDPAVVLEEVSRLLKPGGTFIFLEHVRAAEGTMLGRFQDLVETPHTWVAAGCHPNRRTETTLGASRLRVTHLEHGRQPRAVPTVRPTIRGTAVREG